MRYQTFLKAGLWSIILLFILSLACTAVTVHYWIIGDWLMSRGVEIAGVSTAGMLVVDHAILILYIDDDTNATIISACLGLLAGIVGFIAWYKLRRTDMDADHQLVRGLPLSFLPLRLLSSLPPPFCYYTTFRMSNFK